VLLDLTSSLRTQQATGLELGAKKKPDYGNEGYKKYSSSPPDAPKIKNEHKRRETNNSTEYYQDDDDYDHVVFCTVYKNLPENNVPKKTNENHLFFDSLSLGDSTTLVVATLGLADDCPLGT